jgi:hypothetical protein
LLKLRLYIPVVCWDQKASLAFPPAFQVSLTASCRLNFIPRARLLNLFRQDPHVGYQIVRILSEAIADMRQVKSELALISQDWTAQ